MGQPARLPGDGILNDPCWGVTGVGGLQARHSSFSNTLPELALSSSGILKRSLTLPFINKVCFNISREIKARFQ
jgi:hypothetical protein